MQVWCLVPCFNNVMCRNSSGFVFTSRKYVILYRIPENAFLFVYAVFFDNDHRDAYIGGDTVESITTSGTNIGAYGPIDNDQ